MEYGLTWKLVSHTEAKHNNKVETTMKQQDNFVPTWKESRKAEWAKKKSYKHNKTDSRGKPWK